MLTSDGLLAVLLAVIAALVAVGILCRWDMWSWIVGYWTVLTVKNVLAARKANARQSRGAGDMRGGSTDA